MDTRWGAGLLQEGMKVVSAVGKAQPRKGLLLDLTDPLPSQPKLASDLFKRSRSAILESKT